MKEKANFEAPFVALILILAGTLSPSNGIDDAVYKTPSELITSVLRVMAVSVAVYLLWTFAENQIKNQETKPSTKHLRTLSIPKIIETIFGRNR